MALPGLSMAKRANPVWLADPDVKLMLRVQQDDMEAFAELTQRYGRRVLGYFRRQIENRTEAEDLTQEVFLRLYRYRERYQPRARFATWIFFIARNVARNARRSQHRHPCVNLDGRGGDDSPLASLLSPGADTPSSPLERDELARVVRSAVARLAGRQRLALELHQFEEQTYAEVGAKLHMTAKAAKSLLYRARNQLRELLTPFVS